MDSFVEKFNVFDLFTMLIPGIIISTSFSVSLSYEYYDLWESFGNEKYIVFFIISYLFGVIYQEIGTIFDNLFLYKILYGGNPREIFLTEEKYRKIFNDELSYKDAMHIRDYYVNFFNIKNIDHMNKEQEKALNSLIFSYCLNTCEKNNLIYKPDKMIAISEMSRSLFLGCISNIILDLYMILKYSSHYKFYCIEIIILIILFFIFLCRKVRYEKYRIRIVLRSFLIHIKEHNVDNK
jgi:hypothetical protein